MLNYGQFKLTFRMKVIFQPDIFNFLPLASP